VEGPWAAVDAAFRSRDDVTAVVDRGAAPGTTSYYRLVIALRQGGQTIEGPLSAGAASLVTDLTMRAPNPAPGVTRIDFALARAGTVRLSVIEVTGRECVVLARGEYGAGQHSVRWDGRTGSVAPAGIYFVRFRAAGTTRVRKLVML